jgi:hypothetical protein
MPQLATGSCTLPSGPRKCCQVGPRLTRQSGASAAQFLDGRRQVTDRQPGHRPGIKVLPTLVERAEAVGIAAIGELEGPQAPVRRAPA